MLARILRWVNFQFPRLGQKAKGNATTDCWIIIIMMMMIGTFLMAMYDNDEGICMMMMMMVMHTAYVAMRDDYYDD